MDENNEFKKGLKRERFVAFAKLWLIGVLFILIVDYLILHIR